MKKDLSLSQERTAQRLNTTSLAELERDIDNERARPVRGDGQEMPRIQREGLRDEANELGGSEPESDVERPSWTRRRSNQLLNRTSIVHPLDDSRSPKGGPARSPTSQLSHLTTSHLTTNTASWKLGTPLTEESVTSVKRERPRNHRRGETAGQLRLSNMAMSTISITPTPTTRSRSRAISHPDIFSLCQDWANKGPTNQTRYVPSSQTESTVDVVNTS